MTLQADIEKLKKQFLEELKKPTTSVEIEELKVKYLGKKGYFSALMGRLRECSKEEKPKMGKFVNDAKQEVQVYLETALQKILDQEINQRLENENLDVTLPGRKKNMGSFHPISQVSDRMLKICEDMGFSVQIGPDLDSDYYNFEALNFEDDHPARDMQDTFYVTDSLLLRTHTSNVQVRFMENNQPPLRVVSPGRVFRNETVSSRSHVFFHQIEGFYVDKKVSFSDLMATLEEFWSKFWNQKIDVRYRPSYFPFVEPGMEVDVSCVLCKGKGCRVCKNSGWLEVAGAGMIHPNVLKAGKINPEVYSGYAWGIGIDRTAMLYYGINDIRLFTENNLRFLNQFRNP